MKIFVLALLIACGSIGGVFYFLSRDLKVNQVAPDAKHQPNAGYKTLSSQLDKNVLPSRSPEFPKVASETPDTLKSAPTFIQDLFDSQEMSMDEFKKVEYENGEKGFAWKGIINKALEDSYGGWRSRLREKWLLIDASRGTTAASMQYYSADSRIKVDLMAGDNSTKQQVYIIVK